MNPLSQEDAPGPADTPRPATPLERAWRWARLALVVGIIILAVAVAKPSQLWRALTGARYDWALAAVPFAASALMLDALKLGLLMRPHGFRGGWRAIVKTSLVVNLVSIFLPVAGGSAVAWVRLSKQDNLRAQTFVALAMNTLLKLVVVAGAGAFALALDARGAEKHKELLPPLLALAALPLAALALMLWTGALGWLEHLRTTLFVRFMPKRIHVATARMLEALAAYRTDRLPVILGMAAGVVRKLCENVVVLFALRAVGVTEIGFFRLLWIQCAVEAISMTPLALTGVGLPQVAYVGLLAAFGVGADRGVASQAVMWAAAAPLYLAAAVIMLAESASPARRSGSSPQGG